MCDKCELTEFGCCDDLENAAKGPDFEGCPTGNSTAFVDCTTTVNTVNIFLLGPFKMTKTPKLTLINTDNVFVLGPLKRIKTSKLSLELYCICRLHNNGRYSQCFSTWPLKVPNTPMMSLIDTNNVFVLGPLKMIKTSNLIWNSTGFVDCTTTVYTVNVILLCPLKYQRLQC